VGEVLEVVGEVEDVDAVGEVEEVEAVLGSDEVEVLAVGSAGVEALLATARRQERISRQKNRILWWFRYLGLELCFGKRPQGFYSSNNRQAPRPRSI